MIITFNGTIRKHCIIDMRGNMKITGPIDVLVVLGHAAEFNKTDESVRDAAQRMLPNVEDEKLRKIVESYITSPTPMADIRKAIAKI